MLKSFIAGYQEAGGRSPTSVIGTAVGLVFRTALQTAVVVLVLKMLGFASIT